jgi:hypothetical protein
VPNPDRHGRACVARAATSFVQQGGVLVIEGGNLGAGTVKGNPFGASFTVVASGNGDGKADLLSGDSLTGDATVQLLNGTTATAQHHLVRLAPPGARLPRRVGTVPGSTFLQPTVSDSAGNA